MKPTVSRMVHYVSRGSADGVFPSACRAAVVTDVVALEDVDELERSFTNYIVSLCVLNPEGMFFNTRVDQDESYRHTGTHVAGTWHWPEREA